MLKNAIAIAVASATLVAAPVVSAAETETQQVRVPYSDLDLSSEQGREELDRRIRDAAREMCGQNEVKTGTRIPSSESKRCYRNARAQLDQHFAQIIETQQQLGG